MKRRNSGHTTRNVLLFVTGAGLAAAVSPKLRTRVVDAVRGVNFAGISGRRDSQASIEQEIEVNVPVRTAYNQWTQFEEFPKFMEGVDEVKQLDDTLLHWAVNVAGKKAEWDAKITEQKPDRRIAWESIDGKQTRGAVTFEPAGSGSAPGSACECPTRPKEPAKRSDRRSASISVGSAQTSSASAN